MVLCWPPPRSCPLPGRKLSSASLGLSTGHRLPAACSVSGARPQVKQLASGHVSGHGEGCSSPARRRPGRWSRLHVAWRESPAALHPLGYPLVFDVALPCGPTTRASFDDRVSLHGCMHASALAELCTAEAHSPRAYHRGRAPRIVCSLTKIDSARHHGSIRGSQRVPWSTVCPKNWSVPTAPNLSRHTADTSASSARAGQYTSHLTFAKSTLARTDGNDRWAALPPSSLSSSLRPQRLGILTIRPPLTTTPTTSLRPTSMTARWRG